MEARQALDLTLKKFNLKATDIAKKAGIGTNELSRYRRGHNDILASRLVDILRALPLHAQMYFFSLCISVSEGERTQAMDTEVAA